MTLATAVRAARRQLWLILVVVVAACGGSLFLSSTATPRYRATATVIVQPASPVTDKTALINSLTALQSSRIVPTYADIAASPASFKLAADRVGLAQRVTSEYHSEASVEPESLVLQVQVTGPDRAVVLRLAQQLVAVSSSRFGDAYPVYRAATLAAPAAPAEPESPRVSRDVTVALLLGLLVGGALAVALDAVLHGSPDGYRVHPSGLTASEAHPDGKAQSVSTARNAARGR